jgi:hypothetical protein
MSDKARVYKGDIYWLCETKYFVTMCESWERAVNLAIRRLASEALHDR